MESPRIRAAAAVAILTLLGAGAPAPAATRALLVGAGHYPHLGEPWQLAGPANDVELLAALLVDGGFGVDEGDVTRLAGWPGDPAARPTRDNILRELDRLAGTAGRGDQVLIFLAGHGSQQPADDDPDDPEPDGMDEIFLPADAGSWNAELGRVEGAISDDELRAKLQAIRARGAFVWALIDTCHSGTMTRGGGERERRVPSAALGIPAAATTGGERTRGGVVERRNLELDGAGGLVAMYAAQPHELAPERALPGPDSRTHGVFSYTVAEILKARRSSLTYRELAAEVTARYRGMGRTQPTPLIEGGDLDREVLGLTVWPERPGILLGEAVVGRPEHYVVEAGDLDGLSSGTVLAVYPPAGAEDAGLELGHVQVVEVEPLTAIVSSVEASDGGWRPVARDAPFAAGSRCAVRWVDYGDLRMRIALQRGEGEILAAGAGPAALEAALSASTKRHGNLLARVDRVEEAEWLVRLAGDDVVLVPASGWSRSAAGEGVPRAFRVGTLADGEALAAQLGTVLETIARAHHLLGLENAPGFGYGAVSVDVRIFRLKDRADRVGEPAEWGPEGLVLQPGQWVAFEITNPSIVAVDVTLLFVDSGYGIRPLFPLAGASNRLGPMERAFPIYRTRLSADTLGEESVVAIAVKADGPPRSFAGLAQPTLERYRASERTRGGGGDTPLARLLESAVYGLGTTRGLEAEVADAYAVTVLPWVTRE